MTVSVKERGNVRFPAGNYPHAGFVPPLHIIRLHNHRHSMRAMREAGGPGPSVGRDPTKNPDLRPLITINTHYGGAVMYIQYNGQLDDEFITDIIEDVLEKRGLGAYKNDISREILSKLEDFFMECSNCG